MTEQNILRKEMLDEIVNRKNLGDKKFHSETSLQQFGENEIDIESRSDENDPGVCKFCYFFVLMEDNYN